MTAATLAAPAPAPAPGAAPSRTRRFLTQLVLVVLINVPSLSFGLAMGWVSLESGAGGAGGARGAGEEGAQTGAALVGAAATTFLTGALAMPVAARALASGRKPTMLATSAVFIVCWSLKLCWSLGLCGGWGLLAGRAAAGLGGVAAWVIPPLLANEMCVAGVRGAAAVALVLAHNAGFLLMYLAADYGVPDTTVVASCLALSALHCAAYLFVPESPAYLAASGKHEEARAALAWCGGYCGGRGGGAALEAELKALPAPDLEPVSPFALAKDMLSDVRRRKAFLISLAAVAGQEMCGVLTLLQFAERVFHLAGEGQGAGAGGRRASADAVVLGSVQLVASALSLYLVEKIGRRPLFVWGALGTGAGLALGAGAVWAGAGGAALLALAAAVACDSAGLQPAPYALLPEMFTYQYRGCAVLLATAAGDLANALEIVVFPALVQAAGLAPALALAAALTLALAALAARLLPETMDRTVEDIYRELCPRAPDPEKPRRCSDAARTERDRPADTHRVLTEKYINDLNFSNFSCDNHRSDEKHLNDGKTDNVNHVAGANVESLESEINQHSNPEPDDIIDTTNIVLKSFNNDAFRHDEVSAPKHVGVDSHHKHVHKEANDQVDAHSLGVSMCSAADASVDTARTML